MKKSNLILIVLIAAAASFFVWVAFVRHHSPGNAGVQTSTQSSASSSALAAQTNTEGSVQMSVQPTDLQSSEWKFEVSMNTHSGELPKDLIQMATLSNDNGKTAVPIRWEPGTASSMPGHHDSGTLVFPSPASKPKSVALTIANIGEVVTRTFTWNLQQ